MPKLFLKDRLLLRVSGADASPFLQNLITTDLSALATDEARPGALLTPQGKILFDFMIWRTTTDFLSRRIGNRPKRLLKRLIMYRLRSPVGIAAVESPGVTVSWDGDAGAGAKDARFAKAGVALTRGIGDQADVDGWSEGDETAYRTLRIACGIAVSGSDFALSGCLSA